MKKLIATLTLVSSSCVVMAVQPTLPLQVGQILNTSAVKQTIINEGQALENVWFEVETHQVKGTSSYHLSSCTLSADLSLNKGSFNLKTKQLRCISDNGDIFTDTNLAAKFLPTTKDVCSSRSATCSQVTLRPSGNYTFEVERASNLEAEFNAMREVNRSRLQNE